MTAIGAHRMPVEALAAAAGEIAESADLRSALAAVAAAAVDATGADLVVLRVLGDEGELVARVVAPETSALAPVVAGTRASCDDLGSGKPSDAVARAAEQAHAGETFVEAARAGGRVIGSVEALGRRPFSEAERAALALVVAEVALAVRTLGLGAHSASGAHRAAWLELAGEALAAGGDSGRAAQLALRIAAAATGARAGVLWRLDESGDPVREATFGEIDSALPRAAAIVDETLDAWRAVAVEHDAALPVGLASAATLPLGQPPFAALQLFFAEDGAPAEADLQALAGFAARVAHALRAGDRARATEVELERTRALLDVVSEAISRLSLAHTLETAVERIADLLQVERVGIYLRDDGPLFGAAGRGIGRAHDDVAGRISDAFAGPLRARVSVHARVGGDEPALSAVRAALGDAGESSVVAVPLHVREESIGLLTAYPERRGVEENEIALLAALAAQLAVAVQNARLHERATELGSALADVLASEREASRQVNALYEISRSFAQTLSLDSTLAAVTETLVREFHVDAAVIRVPDERGDQLVPRAVHVAESRLADAVRTILERPQPRPPRSHAPVLLDPATVTRLGGAHALLRPFLEKGSTAALLSIATPTELLAELTIVSLDPAVPITDETLASARTIAQQAALAIDNARLYQQQKQFAETMQQSLLPREDPAVPGLEVGRVYESAAQVDVGGDVYDFLELADGRLAVVLGDVTGHGIDATADMAMAKFVFRSLAREHSEPSEFLARANEVVVSEIAVGKFITMVYVTVDAGGEVLCASAGHPEPRIVHPDGRVEGLACGGLALGIVAPQEYDQVVAALPSGGAVVLYTDGVIESRRDRELFGTERLDEVLAANASRPAQEQADAVLAACQAYSGGALPDDCAIVVIRRVA